MADKPAGTNNQYTADLRKYERLYTLQQLIWCLEDEWRQGRITGSRQQLALLDEAIDTIGKLIEECEEQPCLTNQPEQTTDTPQISTNTSDSIPSRD